MIQLQVLNKILRTKDSSMIELNSLTEDYFSQYPKEFKFIQQHLDVYGKVPDTETFLSTFPNFEIISVEEPDDYLIAALIDEYKSREIIKSMNGIRDYLNMGDTERATELYKDSLEKISKVGVTVKPINLVTDQHRYDEYVSKINNFNEYYISTGLKEVDELLGGGFDRKEELVVVVARPGVGKSWISLKFATEAAMNGLRVGLYSGEMADTKVGYRFDTLAGHINNGGITHGNISFQVEYKEYLDKLRDNCKGEILVITPSMFNGYATVNNLRNFVEKHHLDLLVVDQLSLLDEPKGRTQKEKTANLMVGLKKLQSLEHIPVIAVSQQNRTKNEDGLDLTQIANADEVGQFATIVIFVEKKDGVVTLYFEKVRDGSTGKKLTYNVDLNRGNFIYLPDEKDGVKGGGVDKKFEERYKPKKEGDYF